MTPADRLFPLVRLAFAGPPDGVPVLFWRRIGRLRRIAQLVALSGWGIAGCLLVGMIIAPVRTINVPCFVKLIPLTHVTLSMFVHRWIARASLESFREYLTEEAYQVCPACGYSLRGLPDSHDCPECSSAYDRKEVEDHWKAWSSN